MGKLEGTTLVLGISTSKIEESYVFFQRTKLMKHNEGLNMFFIHTNILSFIFCPYNFYFLFFIPAMSKTYAFGPYCYFSLKKGRCD